MLGMLFYRLLKKLMLFLKWEKTEREVQEVFFRLTEAVPVIGSCLFVFLYGNMTGYGVSTSRAVVMFLLMISAGMFGRTYDIVTGMAAAALFLLLRKPLYIADSGFWLSFLAVFAILGVLPVLEEMVSGKKAGGMKNHKKKSAEKIKTSILASFAIFFVTFPVIIKTYFSYPLYGSFLNLCIIPLMSILLPLAFLAGIVGVFFYPSAWVLAIPVSGILKFYEALCRLVKDFPGAIQLTGCPPDWKIPAYFLGLGILLFLWKKWRFPRCIVLAGACLLIGFMYRLPSSDFKIHFLDIGQGDGIVMELPGGTAVTVDGGSSDVSNAGEYRMLPFLKASGIHVIECAFLTHMDSDHINAMQELLEKEEENGEIFIRKLVVPAVLKEKETWKELAGTAKAKGTRIFYIKAGDRMEMNQESFECLHPSENFCDSSENAASLVLKVTYGMCDILLTGDVEGNGEKFLIENCADELKETDVLKVAHHGSKNSTSEAFLEKCSPFVSIISCGAKNRYGHPHQELMERLWKNGSEILQTKESGEITLITDGEKMKWEVFLRQ
jgi:competence protein ComEC